MRRNGFSLLEMMFATVILLVGLIAIAQIVPTSILLNYRNRMDSSALVFAQGELDAMLSQPFGSNSFTDSLGNLHSLGDPSQPNVLLPDSSAVVVVNGQTLINFADTASPGYSYQTLPDDSGLIYDVRWAVIVTGDGTKASAKRFILGVRQVGGTGYFQPVTLDTVVYR